MLSCYVSREVTMASIFSPLSLFRRQNSSQQGTSSECASRVQGVCAKTLLCSQLDLDCGPIPQVRPASRLGVGRGWRETLGKILGPLPSSDLPRVGVGDISLSWHPVSLPPAPHCLGNVSPICGYTYGLSPSTECQDFVIVLQPSDAE